MTRLLVHVEGQTEETFVEELLRPHLLAHGFTSVSANLMGNARRRENRGGVKPWPAVSDDIVGERGQARISQLGRILNAFVKLLFTINR